MTSKVSTTLPQYVENLILEGTANLRGTGNALANLINGNQGKNTLNGASGDDNLNGGGGKDKLNGGAGKDHLNGGPGKDTLIGGKSADYFEFTDELSRANADKIKDFSHKAGDIMRLWNFAETDSVINRKLLPSEFFVGKHAHDANDLVIYDRMSGKLYFDVDGDGRLPDPLCHGEGRPQACGFGFLPLFDPLLSQLTALRASRHPSEGRIAFKGGPPGVTANSGRCLGRRHSPYHAGSRQDWGASRQC